MFCDCFFFHKKYHFLLAQLLDATWSEEESDFHYANTPMQNIANFNGCKNGHFQMKNCNNFLIFDKNIDHGYT